MQTSNDNNLFIDAHATKTFFKNKSGTYMELWVSGVVLKNLSHSYTSTKKQEMTSVIFFILFMLQKDCEVVY